MKKVFVVFLLLLGGCGPQLRQDPSMSSIDAGYMSAEGRVRGEIFHGISVTTISRGSAFDELHFQIQTYFNGQLKIDGTDCGLDLNKTYMNSELVSVSIPGIANKNCLITFTLSPSLPKQDNSTLKVFGIRGALAVKVVDQFKTYDTRSLRVSGNFSYPLVFNDVGVANEKVKAIFFGCDSTYNKDVELVDGKLTIDLNEIIKPNAVQTCVLEGVIIHPKFKDILVTVMINEYDKSFVKLSIPGYFQKKNGKFCFVTDDAVSLMSLNGQYSLKNNNCFSNPGDGEIIFRELTVKGRTAIGIYSHSTKQFKWSN